jgi:hypothetical protein
MGVLCCSPAYTFVEKLQTVSNKFRNQQSLAQQSGNAASSFPKNFLRHYCDLYCLLDSPEVVAFIGTPAHHARKQERFPAADNQQIACNEAFFTEPDRSSRPLYCQIQRNQRSVLRRPSAI